VARTPRQVVADVAPEVLMVASTRIYEGEYAFRHCVVASTWAFEAQGPGSIPGGGAILIARR
jgi:hypothetical protein